MTRNGAQTAADAAALAAARQNRDEVKEAFLAALTSGNVEAITRLLGTAGTDDQAACDAARTYANQNHADLYGANACERLPNGTGYTVDVITQGTVGSSVIDSTKSTHAKATATAVVEPRCSFGAKDGNQLRFTCDKGSLAINPKAGDFMLDLSDFYSVHLTK